MTRAEMLAIDRRWYCLTALFGLVFTVVSVVSGDWVLAGVCLLVAGHALYGMERSYQ